MHKRAYSSIEIIKLLKTNGFIEVRQKGSHKIFFSVEEKIHVTVPHPRKDLPKGTALSILKLARLIPSGI